MESCNTVLLTLVNKLGSDCNITITYERACKDSMISLTETYKIVNRKSISIQMNNSCTSKSYCILNCLVIRCVSSYANIRFRINEDTIAEMVLGYRGVSIGSIIS